MSSWIPKMLGSTCTFDAGWRRIDRKASHGQVSAKMAKILKLDSIIENFTGLVSVLGSPITGTYGTVAWFNIEFQRSILNTIYIYSANHSLIGTLQQLQPPICSFFGFHLHRIPTCPAPLTAGPGQLSATRPSALSVSLLLFTCLVVITLLRQRSNQSPPHIIWDEVWNNA